MNNERGSYPQYINLIWSHSHFGSPLSPFIQVSSWVPLRLFGMATVPSSWILISLQPTSTRDRPAKLVWERETLFHFYNSQVYGVIPMKTKYLVERCRWLLLDGGARESSAGIKKLSELLRRRKVGEGVREWWWRPLRIYRTVVNLNSKPHQVEPALSNVFEEIFFIFFFLRSLLCSIKPQCESQKSTTTSRRLCR